MSRTLELNCLVLDSDASLSRIFTVEISNTEKVAALKEAVKRKKPAAFQHIDADALDLWNVSIPMEELLEANLRDLLPTRPQLLPVKRLGGIFSNAPLEEHLHIVVRPPPTAAPAEPQSLLELNCLVLGDDRSRIFPVKIANTESVGALREAIKAKKSPLFDHVPADNLVLWKVSEPVDQNLEANLTKIDFVEAESLSPVDELSKTFSDVPVKRHLHIVVERPADDSHEANSEQKDTVSHLSLRIRRLALCHRKPSKAPSSEGYFETFLKEQGKEGHEIYCGRPIRLDRAVPASLFNETLSKFHYDLTHCTPKPEDILCFRKLRANLTEIFPDESQRRDKLIEILREEGIIPPGSHLNPNTIGRYTTDGDLRVALAFGDFLYYVQELKNEWSTGHAEPYFECIHYWWAHVRRHIEAAKLNPDILDHLNFPAILLIHSGSHLSVAVAAWTAELNVETLSTIPLHVHSTNMTGALDAGKRLVCALRTALRSLRTFYENANTLPPQQSEYPFRNYFLDENGNNKYFEFQEQVEDKRIFRASLKDESDTPVYVKFSRRYGKAAHRTAQDARLAPQLYSVEEIYGWYIVVMEDLSKDYDTLSNIDRDQLPSIQQDVKNAVDRLHALGYVHGDIRGLNILVRKRETSSKRPRVILVDWDWSGAIGKVHYPHNMNPELAHKRPVGAVVGAKIEPAHDLDMVSRCFDSNQAS